MEIPTSGRMFSHVQIPMGEPEEEVEKHLDDDELAVDSQPQPHGTKRSREDDELEEPNTKHHRAFDAIDWAMHTQEVSQDLDLEHLDTRKADNVKVIML